MNEGYYSAAGTEPPHSPTPEVSALWRTLGGCAQKIKIVSGELDINRVDAGADLVCGM